MPTTDKLPSSKYHRNAVSIGALPGLCWWSLQCSENPKLDLEAIFQWGGKGKGKGRREREELPLANGGKNRGLKEREEMGKEGTSTAWPSSQNPSWIKSFLNFYRFSILLDIKPGMRISAIHPIVSDAFCSFSKRIFLFSSVNVFESVTCIHSYIVKK